MEVVAMPWFPDFIGAVELARRQDRTDALADPVGRYLTALQDHDEDLLEEVWPGSITVHDPRAGTVHGHDELRRFVRRNYSWLAERAIRPEVVASTCTSRRAVVELLAHFPDGLAWPVAVVAESPEDMSVEFRTYCSQWPVDGKRHLRPPLLAAAKADPGDVVGRHQAAVAAGDVGGVVGTFEPDGWVQEALGTHEVHRGTGELRAFYAAMFGAGGGLGLEHCLVTDDGVRCALEYNLVRWGSHDLPPQAGLGVYERGPDGLLTAVRIYDDVEPPARTSG